MKGSKNTKTVVVVGDVTVDWNIARVKRTDAIALAWNADDLTCAFRDAGGAAMLANLMEAVGADLRGTNGIDLRVRRAKPPGDTLCPDDKRYTHSYAIWAPFELTDPKSNQKTMVWRVQEFLGLYPAQDNAGSPQDWKRVIDDFEDPDVVVLDDACLGFRDQPEYWPKALRSRTAKPWILLKMARPVAQGELWDHLLKEHADRLIVIMTANDLRRSQVQVSRNLSWERTAQDLVWELLHGNAVEGLARCAHVIVSFYTSGAILLSRASPAESEGTLLFDPNAMEDEWGRQYKGAMIGYTSCLTAGIAREIILNKTSPDIRHGVQHGIRAMRSLHMEGFGRVDSNPDQIRLVFPCAQIATKLAQEGDCVAATKIRNPGQLPPREQGADRPREATSLWTIIEDQHHDSLEAVAARVVIDGLDAALSQVPAGRFGGLVTVDRREIESLRSIGSLIGEYCDRRQQEPLSIAVFGPPGAGKSFAVKQVANSVREEEVKEITFNVSQFSGMDDLRGALHQVRDLALSGKMPLVFWDEFDTTMQGQPLGWLKYFLAPMQDGKFQEGPVVHPVGRSIFVFAGGTSSNLESFGEGLSDEQRRAAKLLDFVSRLRGYLDILGPNRQVGETQAGPDSDPYHIIRRAIVLRSILQRCAPRLFHPSVAKGKVNIDSGVLRAFLLTRQYKHGVRSMEAVVNASRLAGKTTFERSCLPSEAQLDLHVHGSDFLSLVHPMDIQTELTERLAQAAHKVFCDDLRAKGYKLGPVTNKRKKEHSSLKPYDQLLEEEKEQNRNNVRDIPNKLRSIGYFIRASRGGEPRLRLTKEEIEILAQKEHERWMKQKLDKGWKHGSKTNKEKKIHKCLLPWDRLPRYEQDKDLALIRGIPGILGDGGYTGEHE